MSLLNRLSETEKTGEEFDPLNNAPTKKPDVNKEFDPLNDAPTKKPGENPDMAVIRNYIQSQRNG